MRNKLFLFILISFLLHLLLAVTLDLSPDIKPQEKPVSVSLIPKEKPKPEAKPEPEPVPEVREKKEQIYTDTPIDEELETDINQMAPVPQKDAMIPKGDKPADKPAERPAEKRPESSRQDVGSSSADVEVPKVEADKKLSKEEIREMLTPSDIIQKYAEGGGMPEGEDHVSMQYVKIRYQSYFYKFARRLYQVWVYPQNSAFRGEQGTVRIAFSIAKDGMISGIKVIESSGYPDLDREAVTALKKTAGVPLPESYDLNFLKVDAYFKYVLNEGFYVY